MQLRSLAERDNWQGTRVIVRSSLNIALRDGIVQHSFRLEQALPTLQYLVDAGAKVVVLAHIGRDPEATLAPVHEALQKHFTVHWAGSATPKELRPRTEALAPGEILLLENVRRDPREKANDTDYAAELAQLGEVYVNDAFANIHREHASMVGIPEYLPAYAGLTLEREVEALSVAMQPEAPSVLILGGAKFATKQPLVEEYLDTYDQIFIGGALAHDFFRARGYEIGQSLTSDTTVPNWLVDHPKIMLPSDVVVERADGRPEVKSVTQVQPDETIFDAGPQTVEALRASVENAATILWNGPLGNYETGYTEATESLAKIVANATGHSVVGGGDTVSSIQQLNLHDKFGFVSTGGGAMLTFLEQGTTPALEALRTDQ